MNIYNFSCLKYIGFFCPPQSLCIIPCPSGAYCVPKKKQLESVSIYIYRACGHDRDDVM